MYFSSYVLYFTLLDLIFMQISSVISTGKVKVLLRTFRNPGGKGHNGQCCDVRWKFCDSQCDHRFIVCLDKGIGRTHDTSTCPYGKVSTKEITDQDNINFGSTIGGSANPMVFAFYSIPSGIRLKIGVWDVDGNSAHDFVVYLYSYIRISPGTSQPISITNRATLTAVISTECDANYYGLKCDVFCVDTNSYRGHYTCNRNTGRYSCLPGWTGSGCKTSTNDCINSPCQHGGTCTDRHLGFECNCQSGFKGLNCEVELDECSSNPCQNNGTCKDLINQYTCSCQNGWSGSNCEFNVDDCQLSPCYHNGTCHDLVAGFKCFCPNGTSGLRCEEDINECEDDPCENNGQCIDGLDEYQCQCVDGWSGKNCEINVDECHSNPCLNNGVCVDIINRYSCTCEKGWTGSQCQINKDECESSPCQQNGKCLDHVGGFTCECTPGTTGVYCEAEINECLSSPCINNGTCIDGLARYDCMCKTGFTGINCEIDIDECEFVTCFNDGTCSNGVGEHTCHCPTGYMGEFCEMNYCNPSPCENNATCIGLMEGFICTCVNGFSGTICEENIDECVNDSCQNNGSCVDEIGAFHCNCMAGFTGEICENEIDHCDYHVCAEGSSCVNAPDDYQCLCAEGWTGQMCDVDIDECLQNPCVNDSTCNDYDGGFECLCGTMATGVLCETLLSACQVSPCENNGTCTDVSELNFFCHCMESWTGLICNETIVNDTLTTIDPETTSEEMFVSVSSFSNISQLDSKTPQPITSITAFSPTIQTTFYKPKEIEIPLLFRGTLDEKDRTIITNGIKEILVKYGHYAESHIRMALKTEYLYGESSEEITEVSFRVVLVPRERLSTKQLKQLFNKLKAEEFYGPIPYQLYVGKTYPRIVQSVQSGFVQRAEGKWIIAVICVAASLCCFIACIAFKKYRNRMNRRSEDISNTLYSGTESRGQAFENILYQEYQPNEIFNSSISSNSLPDPGRYITE